MLLILREAQKQIGFKLTIDKNILEDGTLHAGIRIEEYVSCRYLQMVQKS